MRYGFLMSLLGVGLLTLSMGASAQSLKGVWEGTEIETIGGDSPGVVQLTNPRLLIYTDAYFMWAFDAGDGPRPTLPNGPEDTSDAEFGRVARLFQSNAGTYMRVGNQIIYNRTIALVPNGQQPENQPLVREIRTLTNQILETQLTNDDGVTVVLRYRRVE